MQCLWPGNLTDNESLQERTEVSVRKDSLSGQEGFAASVRAIHVSEGCESLKLRIQSRATEYLNFRFSLVKERLSRRVKQ